MWKRMLSFSLGLSFGLLAIGCTPIGSAAPRTPTNVPTPNTPTAIPETPASITINVVHVDQQSQVIVSGQSTLPDGACILTALSLDGQPVDWWPLDACAELQSSLWTISFFPPNSLNTSAQYQFQARARDDTQVVSEPFYFDLAGPSTSVPAEANTLLAGCAAQPTRTPPPDAPTRIPSAGVDEVSYVDPHVELCARPNFIQVGQQVVIYAQAIDIGLPYFTVQIREGNVSEFQNFVQVTDAVNVTAEASTLLEFVDVERESQYSNRIAIVFTSRQTGTIEIMVSATGEVHYGYPGPATWAGGSSDVLQIDIITTE